jgi:hypothetical protein
VLIPAGWDGTNSSPDADRVMRQERSVDRRGALAATELREVVYTNTLLDRFLPLPRQRKDRMIIEAFDSLQAVASDSALTFTLAHFLMPHRAYRYNAACHPTPRAIWSLGNEAPGAKSAYLGQLQCTNRRVLETVRTILARSAAPPIILLQGDHGTRTVNPDRRLEPGGFLREARERFGAFGAYYLPGGGAERFLDTVSVVNVFRNLLAHYFAADLSPERNYTYFIALDQTYHFIRADTALIAGQRQGDAVSRPGSPAR